MKPLIIAGTDTGVGKTVVSAMLTLCFDGIYWKPVQAGTRGGTDSESVARMTALPSSSFRPERYVLREALSPHRAAELEGITISADDLDLPADAPETRTLIVETAGGVLVPLNRNILQASLFVRWGGTVVLVARTSLGTINHTLLSLEALRQRMIPVLGVIFCGDAMEDSERTIVEFGQTKKLGRLPRLSRIDPPSLREAFQQHFNKLDFRTTDVT